MINLLKLIAKLFGKNAINKTIGTRTNVIQLPNNEIKRYIKQDLNIEAASDAAVMNAKKEMEQLIPEIPKMNDAERLIFEGNLRRLDNRLNPPSAEVFEFGTKQPISKEGIASLTEKAGQKSPPGTVMGNLESRVKQLEASGKSLEEATEGKGKTLDDILGDVMQSQKAMSKLQDEGLVRAAVRYKMMDDLQKGVLKVPKNLEEVIRGASNEEDVINVFRKNYGEDALEQVDSLVPDFYKMTSPKEAVKKIETDFPNIQPKKIEFPETIDIDKLPPEEFATGGRVGMARGGITALKALLNFFAKQKSKKGSDMLREINPKKLGFLENMLMKSDKEMLDANRQEYLENLSDIIKSDKKLLDNIKKMPADQQESFFKKANEGGNQGRLSVYTDPNFNIDDAISEIEQMKKNLKFRNVPEKEIKRQMNAEGGSQGLDYLMGIDRTNYQSGGMTLKQLQAKAPPGEFLAYINPEEAVVLKALGGSGKKINGIPSFFASSPGDTGGAGGADGAGGNDAGGGGSGDTGDMGSEAANAAATAAGAASVGVGGIGGYGDPGVAVGRGFMGSIGNFARNVANMAKANPISSMIASAVLGPIGSLALNTARAYGSTGTTGTVSTNESDETGNALVQQAIADPLGLNASARDMSGVNALYNQYRTNVGFQSGGRVNFNEGTLDPAKQKQVKQMIKMGADTDTISAITGATPEQIQQIQQTPRTKNADGGRIGFAVGSIPKGVKGIQKLIKAMNKKLGRGTITTADELKNPKRKLTDREIELYEEELGDSETWMSSGTLGEAEQALKNRKAYEAEMYRDYKAGRLDPQPGEKGRKQFLEKKSQEMEMSDDKRLMSPDEIEELSTFDLGNEMEQFTKNRLQEKYKGILDDDLLNKMMVDDNPQRLAEVEATIDEAIKMQSMGMNPQEIMSTFKKTPRTKQASGGLSYLQGI